ncbi:MAG TPA: hypothetical protein VFF17_13675 [Thermoanaerobaculia bacterium]|nr:hypothetical protein [Thermoanaerobaculia bacterium]
MRWPSARTFTLAVAAAFLLRQPISGSPTQCVIDTLGGTLVTGGFASVAGWAADPNQGAPVPAIEIRPSCGGPAEIARGGFRPDVMTAFSRPDFLWAGWTGTISLEHAPAGKCSFEVVALSESGEETSCGTREFVVRSVPPAPDPSPVRIAAVLLLRTAGLLAGLFLIGWAPARLFRCEPLVLAAPTMGLALFEIAAQLGARFHIRPAAAALGLTAISLSALALRRRRIRPPARLSSTTIATLAAAVVFAMAGVVPLSLHGEGAVLGDIDDASRECLVADSMARFGWSVPPGARGHLVIMREEWDKARGRQGGIFLLAALAQLTESRSHEVHSPAMLGTGCLVVIATGLLASRIVRGRRKLAWAAPVVVAVNSVLVGALFGQHLGNLLGCAMMLFFLYAAIRLTRSPRLSAATVAPAALAIGAGWTVYPESMVSWAVAAAILVALAPGFERRKRALAGLALAAVLAVLVNPFGLTRAVRGLTGLRQGPSLESPYGRMVVGDTHYFPSIGVIPGLLPYHPDAAPSVGLFSRAAALVAAVLAFFCWRSWKALTGGEKGIVAALLAPVALALYANYRLQFPYGYAKFLLLAVPLWAVAFALLLSAGSVGRGLSPFRGGSRPPLATALLVVVTLASTASAFSVLRRASRAVPSYDSAFRSLPALADAAGRDAVLRIDEPAGARREWMIYFVGTNAVETNPSEVRYPGARHFLLVDRRREGRVPPGPVTLSTRHFALVRIPDTPGWRS